jgi:hypothetical protein
MEEKVIKRHPIYSDYGATENGEIVTFSNRYKNWKPPYSNPHRKGYLQFQVSYEGKRVPYLAHRFVWECFNGIIPSDKVVHHIDHNKTNNSIDNLQLVTDIENKRFAIEAGVLMGAANPKHPWFNGGRWKNKK